MKKAVLMIFLAGCMAMPAMAADAVEPAGVTFTNKREEVEGYASTTYFFEQTTLRFTNCQVFADSAGVVTQGLSGVTVTISVGNTSTNTDYDATVTSTNGGLWSCDVIVPELSTFYVQTKLTDASTNVFVYPWKYMRSKSQL